MKEAIMFVAREKELSLLHEAIGKSNYASLIYGKRRVGKTRLIKEAVKDTEKTVIYYECTKGTIKENVDSFAGILRNEGVLTFSISFETFQDVFAYLNTLSRDFVVIIDEYPYLSSFTETEVLDSAFQTIIDTRLGNISLILSGSQISVMKDLLEERNALYGRFGLVIHLQELNYREAAAFYPSKTPYEKIAFYSVFGGSPFVLQQLRNEETLEQNIIRTILTESNPVHLYASNLLLSDYSGSVNAERILSVLGNGKKKYSELESKLNMNSTGNLAKQLKSLTALELVRWNAPINKHNDTKKKYYEITDNLMRFYYAYVYPNRSSLQMIGEEAFYRQFVAPTLMKDFVPRRFEEQCRVFFALLARGGELPGITNIGTYYYDDPVARKNGEFDVALAFGEDYSIFEVKYFSRPMTVSEVCHEVEQIRGIKALKVDRLGFIAANGFEEKDPDYRYFDGEDLYL